MKIITGVAAAALMIAGLMMSSTDSLSQSACVSAGNHTIQVRPGEDGMPALSYRDGDAEEVHVCIGDQVQWVLADSDRQFFVDFFGNAPFEGAALRGSSGTVLSVVIGGPARRNQGYDYGVNFADEPAMDPRIVVD